MDEKLPHLILPGEFRDESGLVRLTAPAEVHELHPRERDFLQGVMPAAPVVAMARPPSFQDQLHVYATHQNLYELMLDEELGRYLSLKPTTTADVVEMIARLPFEPAMRFASSMQKALALDRGVEWQRRLMYEVYGQTTPISTAGELFLRSQERGAIFSEQQLFALQRLLVLHAADVAAPDLTAEEQIALTLALFYVPGTVLQEEVDLDGDPPLLSLHDERWLRYFVGNGGFAAHGWVKHDMARAHRLYEVIAKSRRARRHHDYCPLEAWLLDEYKMTFCELQALGFVLYAGAELYQLGKPPIAVAPAYYASSALADRLVDGFRALAADRDWFREQFLASAEHPRRAAFEIQPFLRRPGLRQDDGSIVVVAPRAIESWLSANGAYYRFFDLARARGAKERAKFTRFNGYLEESYARLLADVAHPYQGRRTFAVGRVHGEIAYRVKKAQRKTSDVVIDLGTDLVLIEVTAKRLTQKSTVEADAQSILNDLQMMMIDKMRQLGRVIREIFEEPSRVPQLDLAYVQRVWPIVVCGDGVFQGPSTWAHVNDKGGPFLEVPRSVVPAELQPLVLLDLEELELLMGFVAAGHSLTEALERKTSEIWRERDFKSLVHEELALRWTGEVAFVNQEQRRAMRGIRRALDLEGRRRRAAVEVDEVRQAA